MGVSVKADWIESYKSEQNRKREIERGKRLERLLMVAFAVSAIGAVVLTYLSA